MGKAWYRLDNAARVFAALASRRTTTVFRVAATLREPVDRARLEAALAAIMPRFPTFRVRLRTGLFWHWLEELDGAPIVREERRPPCRPMTRAADGPWQLRVLVRDRRIALECSHVLTDGSGALRFLVALLAEYLSGGGVRVPADPRIPRADDEPHPEETEDAYRRFYDPDLPRPPASERAFRLGGTRLAGDDCRVVVGIVPHAPLRETSRRHGVTYTELLVAILLASLLDVAADARMRLAVMTPVDLRRLFPSRTMRNFFLSVTAAVDPRLGAYTFEEILHVVHHSVQGQTTAKNVARQIRRHVGAERNPFIRHVPLLLKIPAKRWLYAHRWGRRYTTALSNVGRVELPNAMREHVERFDVIPNPSVAHRVGCAVVGYGDHVSIAFSSILADPVLERAVFRRLRRMGITARVESNRCGSFED